MLLESKNITEEKLYTINNSQKLRTTRQYSLKEWKSLLRLLLMLAVILWLIFPLRYMPQFPLHSPFVMSDKWKQIFLVTQ